MNKNLLFDINFFLFYSFLDITTYIYYVKDFFHERTFIFIQFDSHSRKVIVGKTMQP